MSKQLLLGVCLFRELSSWRGEAKQLVKNFLLYSSPQSHFLVCFLQLLWSHDLYYLIVWLMTLLYIHWDIALVIFKPLPAHLSIK